jgi:small-conductance mechanosensitive channel
MRKSAAVILLAALACLAPALAAQQPTPSAPVELGGKSVFVLRSGVGSISASERAAIIRQRLEQLARSPVSPGQVRTEKTEMGWAILAGKQRIVSVTADDAKAENTSEQALAEQWAGAIRQGLGATRRSHWRALVGRLATTALVLLALFLAFWLLRQAHRGLLEKLVGRRERLRPLRFRGLEVVSSLMLFRALRRAVQLGYAVVGTIFGLAALLTIFGQFPTTKGMVWQVLLWVWHPVRNMLEGLLNYLPHLATIIVIIVVTRLVLRAIRFVFTQADLGVISLEPWVQRDVARPTGQIIRMIVLVVALFFIAPLIPGTGSTAAKGLSVILGLMVSFGSTSAVGNAVAGVVLTYMRPFRPGDRVKVGEVVGDVVERTFLYTKVRTIKNEEVIIPSLQALSGAMTNYTARAQAPGLILHTSVTISYDAPWRKVHELLLAAADATRQILKEPKPFVLQTSLNDFFVTYQINAYTDRADLMQDTYSELHQNILDSFNKGGIEILSPHYYQLRDGNTSSIPSEHPAQFPRRFLVEASVAGASHDAG